MNRKVGLGKFMQLTAAWFSWDAHSGDSQFFMKFKYLETTVLMGHGWELQ
jgi:hypothetical protein